MPRSGSTGGRVSTDWNRGVDRSPPVLTGYRTGLRTATFVPRRSTGPPGLPVPVGGARAPARSRPGPGPMPRPAATPGSRSARRCGSSRRQHAGGTTGGDGRGPARSRHRARASSRRVPRLRQMTADIAVRRPGRRQGRLGSQLARRVSNGPVGWTPSTGLLRWGRGTSGRAAGAHRSCHRVGLVGCRRRSGCCTARPGWAMRWREHGLPGAGATPAHDVIAPVRSPPRGTRRPDRPWCRPRHRRPAEPVAADRQRRHRRRTRRPAGTDHRLAGRRRR